MAVARPLAERDVAGFAADLFEAQAIDHCAQLAARAGLCKQGPLCLSARHLPLTKGVPPDEHPRIPGQGTAR
jgi:hypothetical protein